MCVCVCMFVCSVSIFSTHVCACLCVCVCVSVCVCASSNAHVWTFVCIYYTTAERCRNVVSYHTSSQSKDNNGKQKNKQSLPSRPLQQSITIILTSTLYHCVKKMYYPRPLPKVLFVIPGGTLHETCPRGTRARDGMLTRQTGANAYFCRFAVCF